MHPILALPGRPVVFLLWFAVIAAVLLQAWSWLGEPYSHALVWLVNVISSGADAPRALQLPGTAAQGAMGSAFVAAIALFVATPSRGIMWKCRWSAIIMAMLFLLHAGLLTVQVRMAYASMAAARAAPQAFVKVLEQVPDSTTGGVAAAWYWLFPLCSALVWFAAIQRPSRV